MLGYRDQWCRVPGILPQVYQLHKMVSRKYGGMFARGWHLDVEASELTTYTLQDAIMGPLKFKEQKSTKKIKLPQTKQSRSTTSVEEVSHIGGGEGSTSKNVLDPKTLEKVSKKAKRKAIGGMEQYNN